MEGKANGKVIGMGKWLLIILGIIAIVTLIVVAITLITKGHPQATPTPPSGGGGGASLPSCQEVQRICRKKCINKWWIPVVGITQYQKCMDGCIVENPCM